MRSNVFKPLPFLPDNHHLNRWAFGYYLVKIGFSNSIVQKETSFSYKQVRKIREDLSIRERRCATYGQNILAKTDWIIYSSATQIYCELREKLTHLESVLEAYAWLKSKKDFDISGFYRACEEISTGEAFFAGCVHCDNKVFSGSGLRDKVVSCRCPACGKTNWERPQIDHRIGHIAILPRSHQQSLF